MQLLFLILTVPQKVITTGIFKNELSVPLNEKKNEMTTNSELKFSKLKHKKKFEKNQNEWKKLRETKKKTILTNKSRQMHKYTSVCFELKSLNAAIWLR